MSLTAWIDGCLTYLKSLEARRVEFALQKLERENPVWGAKLRAAWIKEQK